MARRDRKATRIGAQRLSRRMGSSDPRNHRRENRRQLDGDLDETLAVDKDGRVGIVLGSGLSADRNGLKVDVGESLTVSDQGCLEVVRETLGKGLRRDSRGMLQVKSEKFTNTVTDGTGGTAATSLVPSTSASNINDNFASILAHIENLRRAIERQGTLTRS